VIGELNRRKGVIQSSEENEGMCTIEAEVRLVWTQSIDHSPR